MRVIAIFNVRKNFIYNIAVCCLLTSVFIILILSNISINVMNETDANQINLPIIMYHSIMKSKSRLGKFVVSSKELESDLKYLSDNGYHTIFINDLIDFVYSEKELPEKPIILTFDDGYYNNYLYAFPLMKKYNCKMVISPIGKCIDTYSESNDKNPAYSHATWSDLREMQDSGLVEIQNHSYNMHSCKGCRFGAKIKRGENVHEYKKIFSEDVCKLQEKINLHLNVTPTTFTYPFGAFTKHSEIILKELGFKATLSCENRVNKVSHDPECLYGLARLIRPSGISTEKFFRTKL